MSDNGTLESRTLKEVKKMGHNPIAISIVDGEEAFVFQTKEESEIAEEDFAPEGVYFSKDEFEGIVSDKVYSLIEKPKPKKKPTSKKKPIGEDFDSVGVEMKIKMVRAGKHPVHKVSIGKGISSSSLPSYKTVAGKLTKSKDLPKIKKAAIKAAADMLGGRTFVFTGFRDARLKEAIEKSGGDVIPRVRKNATDLICKTKGRGTAKEVQAAKYGLKISTMDEFEDEMNKGIYKAIKDLI